MVKSFIQALYEAEIQNTELALATESFSDELQSIIEKINNLKIKDLAEIVKKLKYDNNIEKAESFNQEMTQNFDTVIQALTQAKNNIDNSVVQLFQGQEAGMGGVQGSGDDLDMGSFEDDFGGEDFDEFSDENEYNEEDAESDLDLSDIDFGEVSREMK